MKKATRYIIIALVICILAGVSYGLYLFFKKSPTDLASEKADYKTSGIELFNEFNTNQDSAYTKYYQKVVEVESVVKELDLKDTANLFVIVGENESTSISCKFSASYLEELKKLTAAQKIIVKGEVAGFDDLFMQVKMQRCSLVE